MYINRLKAVETAPDNSYLVSQEVKYLYTKIPNSEGIKAVETSLDNFSKKAIASKVLTTFLSLVLTLNNFVFNNKSYIQIKGYAKGTICVPSYASMFMHHFERKYISLFLKGISLIYLSFIKDIFFL